ncbi:MAG: efflux RND transporter permease subunit [Bacteroidales bacterium]|nr:efflux RND transporter permease subunit [Bacteroidales bacterium]
MNKEYFFMKRKVMAVSISVLILLIGFISLSTLPIEQYPDIAPPTINIEADYTGADANSVMTAVIMPIEESINGVEGMTYITSTASSSGNASIEVFFEQGVDPDMAAVNVQNRVAKVQSTLPQEVLQNGIKVTKKQKSMLQISALVSKDGRFDNDFITNYLDINVIPKLMRINGVGGVTNLGNVYSLRIWFHPDQMAAYNLMPNEVIGAISTQNFVAPAGSLGQKSSNMYEYTMEYSGRLKDIEEFKDIVVKTGDNGKILRLRDVADVELGALSYSFSSDIDGKPGVVFIVYQAAGANATQVNAQIGEAFEEIQKEMPAGLEFTILQTADDFLFAAIHNVVETLIIAIILVILVVFFFLQDFKSTIIPSISIIVSTLGTFAVVKLAGFSLNILTLFALVLSIGTVVDDAIVVVEAVMAKLEGGAQSARKATNEAMHEVMVPVISCTLVFMAVFIPTTFMPGTSGKFFTQFGITIASSVGISCISALTLCPALCGIMMRPKDEKVRKNISYYVKKAYDASYSAMKNKYMKAVQIFIKKPVIAAVALVCAIVLMVWTMKTTPTGLIPQEDQGVILVDVSTAPGNTLEQTQKIMEDLKKDIMSIPEIETCASVSGFGMLSSAGSNYGTLIMRLKNWDDRKGIEHSINMVIYKYYLASQKVKEASVVPFQMPQIPGYGTGNMMELVLEDRQGGDMSVFAAHANRFLEVLQSRPEIDVAMTSYNENFPKYKVDVDAAQCMKSGITPQEVLNVLGAYCGGAYCGKYNKYGKIYNIMAKASPEYTLDPVSLNNIFVRTGDKMAPVSQFVTLTPTLGSSVQKRFNLFNAIFCNIQGAAGYSTGQVQKVIAEVAAESLPAGYGYEYAGISREEAKTAGSNSTIFIYAICVLLIYLILASLYESWFVPLAVLMSVPFGLMGAFFFTKITGFENNVYLQTGVIMLIGLLAKTAILITEFATERRAQGLSILDAARQACDDRFRPIMMTVLTMVAGMIPLIIEGGAGAMGNRSLAIGVTGGMIVGTIALLFVTPAFFIIFQKLHEKISQDK